MNLLHKNKTNFTGPKRSFRIIRSDQRPRHSSSSGVLRTPGYSYYGKRSADTRNARRPIGEDDNSRAQSRARWKHHLLHAPTYIALGAILTAMVYSCWLSSSPRIVIFNVTGSVHRGSSEYQQAALKLWKSSPLSHTKFSVHSDSIRRDMLGEFNELADVRVALPLLGSKATIYLTPERPVLELTSNNGTFYLSKSGKVMASINDLSQNDVNDLPVIRDESGILAEVGKAAIPEPQTDFLIRLYSQLRSENISAESIVLPAKSANEVDVRTVGQKYLVKFSSDSDPRQAVGSYLAAKAKLEADHIVPAEYMDVRVEEKVFYK